MRRSAPLVFTPPRRAWDQRSATAPTARQAPPLLRQQTLKPSQRAPDELVRRVLAAAKLVPCQVHGPYEPEWFHNNVSEKAMGFYDLSVRADHDAKHRAKLAKFASWEAINIFELDADWTMTYGTIGCSGFLYSALKPRLQQERAKMRATYLDALEVVKTASVDEAAAFADLATHRAYASFESKPKKGTQTGRSDPSSQAGRRPRQLAQQSTRDLCELYRGAWTALPGLWRLATRLAKMAGDGVAVDWGIKTLLRLKKKVVEKYNGNASHVRHPGSNPKTEANACIWRCALTAESLVFFPMAGDRPGAREPHLPHARAAPHRRETLQQTKPQTASPLLLRPCHRPSFTNVLRVCVC